MTDKEILEGNRLIAEFMGYVYNDVPKGNPHNVGSGITKTNNMGDDYYFSFPENELLNFPYPKYHEDWNWLMPACAKFDNLSMSSRSKEKRYERSCDTIDWAVTCYEILPAFEALVDGIKWYNQNKDK